MSLPEAPLKRLSLGEQLAASLRDAILGGQLQAGESLPSERDLADRYGVNRSSVREAVRRLEGWGLVEIRQGGATRITDFLVSAGIQLLPHLIAPGGRLDPRMLHDLLDLRLMVLSFSASRAATRRDPQETRALREALERLECATNAEERQLRDFAFFERLSSAAGNRVIDMVARAVRAVYLEHCRFFLSLYALPMDLGHHREAVGAIERGEPRAASNAMEAYGGQALDYFKASLL